MFKVHVAMIVSSFWMLGCDCSGQPASIVCPGGYPPKTATYGGSGGASSEVPCGPTPCDDGQGGLLQDVGEHCAGDDFNPAPANGPSCCHGLTCSGVISTDMGTCVRVSASAGSPMCPLVWLYSCDGFYQTKDGGTLNWTGTFTGPPPSEIPPAQGGLGSWMKIKFFAQYSEITKGGAKYFLITAKNCHPIGPYPGP